MTIYPKDSHMGRLVLLRREARRLGRELEPLNRARDAMFAAALALSAILDDAAAKIRSAFNTPRSPMTAPADPRPPEGLSDDLRQRVQASMDELLTAYRDREDLRAAEAKILALVEEAAALRAAPAAGECPECVRVAAECGHGREMAGSAAQLVRSALAGAEAAIDRHRDGSKYWNGRAAEEHESARRDARDAKRWRALTETVVTAWIQDGGTTEPSAPGDRARAAAGEL